MIDTIKLELQQSMYTILDHELFSPSTRSMWVLDLWTKGSQMTSKQNPTVKDRKQGIYKPRLSLRRRKLKHLGWQNVLYVEVSLPKLVFGNNFDELTNDDFELVKEKLFAVLETQGVKIFKNQFNPKISAIHYGKNLILDDFSTPYTYIKELKKIDVSKIYDVNQTDYKNGGLSYKLHSNLFEFTFYDKLKELGRSKISEKRSVNNDDYCQLSLLDHIKQQERKTKPFQVLRIEMRLNKRTKIRQTLKKYGLSDRVDFKYLFDQDIAKLLLSSYYQQILKNYIPTVESNDISVVFQQLKAKYPRSRDDRLLELASAQILINKEGVREFRNLINDKTWYRLKRRLLDKNSPNPHSPLSKIKQNLEKFEVVRLLDYPQLLINNDKYAIN